ncbi:MAG: cysteine desulfurase family protein [Planctomycetaceae bacterium]
MIYLDHHATTPVDPLVVEAMVPWMTTLFGNPHSHTHSVGRHAAAACEEALGSIASQIGGFDDSIVVTSGATESNNLAIQGVMRHPRQRRRHLITAAAEHPSVLDPIVSLGREGFRVTVLPVRQQDDPSCGQIDLDQLRDALDDDTALVSLMWANNEIGTIQPMAAIAEVVHQAGALLHCDATQAVGHLAIDMDAVDIDLLSASAHKFYGPKGVGLLAIGKKRRVRLRPQLEGGGQQHGLRSGTINVAGLIGMSEALRICYADLAADNQRQRSLRDRLWQRIHAAFPDTVLNGPALGDDKDGRFWRLPNNLNLSFADVEGETLMAAAPDLAISSGSACSSVDPRPSHVLTAIGLSESRARRSLRFGLGRNTTTEEIDAAVQMLMSAHAKVATK